jgi:hypothetical protein
MVNVMCGQLLIRGDMDQCRATWGKANFFSELSQRGLFWRFAIAHEAARQAMAISVAKAVLY